MNDAFARTVQQRGKIWSKSNKQIEEKENIVLSSLSTLKYSLELERFHYVSTLRLTIYFSCIPEAHQRYKIPHNIMKINIFVCGRVDVWVCSFCAIFLCRFRSMLSLTIFCPEGIVWMYRSEYAFVSQLIFKSKTQERLAQSFPQIVVSDENQWKQSLFCILLVATFEKILFFFFFFSKRCSNLYVIISGWMLQIGRILSSTRHTLHFYLLFLFVNFVE